MSVVPLADAKAFLNITSTTHDLELQDTLDRAEATLTARVGALGPVSVAGEVHTGPGPLLLKRYPVVSVTSAISGGVAVTDLDLDADAGLLYGSFSPSLRSVKVTYTTGRAVLSADLEAAVLELLRHLWETQRVNNAPRLSSDDETRQGVSYLLPYRVQSLIEPHLLPGVVG